MAAPIAERYIALACQKHGDDHTENPEAIFWLANVYRAQGRYAEADPLACPFARRRRALTSGRGLASSKQDRSRGSDFQSGTLHDPRLVTELH
jgi:hypothetical protein